MKRLLPIVALLLTACSADQALSGAPEDMVDDAVATDLRVDVYPPSLEDGTVLPAQSHYISAAILADHTLNLVAGASFTGTVTAEVATAWGGLTDVPTEIVPIEATITAIETRGLLCGAGASDAATGAFAFELPDYDTWSADVLVVPADGSLAPFVLLDRAISGASSRTIRIPLGAPVYGRVTDAGGAPVPRVAMRLLREDEEKTVEGRRFEADDGGWFVTRVVEPGAYTLRTLDGATGGGGNLVPELTFDVRVDDLAAGATISPQVGDTRASTVSGIVTDVDGTPVADARVRLTSVSLSGSDGTSTREATTNREGRFYVDVLHGTWSLSVTAPFDLPASPATLSDLQVDDDVEVDALRLGRPRTLSGLVRAAGTPVPDATITATQVGFEGFVYAATTGPAGRFELSVPDGAWQVEIVPPSVSVPGAAITTTLRAGEEATIDLPEGLLVSGTATWEGAPVPWALLELYDPRTGARIARGTANDAGNYQMRVFIPEPDDTQEGNDTGTDTGEDTGEDTGARR